MGFYTKQKESGTVLVSSTDTTHSFLLQKILAGSGITVTQGNVGGNETLTLSAAAGSGVLVSDISSQFNGSLTTFTVPSYSSIIMFIITGWAPNGALRPTVDFTTPTSTTVALVTAQVSAPPAGTTGIILYKS